MARNVILIILDSVRADHLSCYGYFRKTTPTLDDLSRRSILWEHAYSTTSWTKPSVASILSGLYPSQHGVLKGPKRTRGRQGLATDALPADVPHVAEQFALHGVRCAAFLNNVQLETYTNFHRGFDVYEPVCRKADSQLERFGRWLDSNGREPFFAYIHFMETHWPYKPRRRHVQEFGGSRDASRFDCVSALELAKLRRDIKQGHSHLAEADLEDFVRMYDASIRRLDGKVRDLRRIIEQHGAADETAMVVTADHGEEFLEHGSIGHGQSLYAEVTHVPLLMCPPQRCPAERRQEFVSLVDIPRTLLALAGIRVPFPGNSLLENGPRSAAYCELSAGRAFHRAVAHQGWRLYCKARSETADFDSQQFARRICRGEPVASEKVELFDIRTDPAEKEDLSAQPGTEKIMESLDSLMWEQGQLPESEACNAEVDDVVLSRLQDLGYVE